MKYLKTFVLVLLIGCAMLAAPMAALAQDIEVSPMAWDFGDIVVGDSAIQRFTISSTGSTALMLYVVELTDEAHWEVPYEGDDFEITEEPDPGAPREINPGESVDYKVTYTPTSYEFHEAYLRVSTNSGYGHNEIYIHLTGMGVEDSPPVAEVMAELLSLFNTAVTDETIVGSGPGNSADGRLGAFGNMLNAANDLIVAGEYDVACRQLQDAHDRCDGFHPPPDFIGGSESEREAIASKIMDVMDALGCP